MKFIRDIIGEKRQLNHQANGISAANGTGGLNLDDMLSPSVPAPDAAEPLLDEMTPQQPTLPDAISDPASKPESDMLSDVTEGLAEFFAQEDKAKRETEAVTETTGDIEPVAPEMASPPELTKLVLGKQAGAVEAEVSTDQFEPTDAIEDPAEPISEADAAPDQSPEPVMRTANTARPPEDREEQNLFAPEPDMAEPESAPVQADPSDNDSAVTMPAQDDPVVSSAPQPVDVPQPAMGRGASRQGRVKTRLLGFNVNQDADIDPIAGQQDAVAAPFTTFPVGWLIITDGPGRGSAFTLFNGVSKIGRGKDQTVPLDFGDNSISRENHAAIAYDPAQKSFYIGHGGKANLVRRNDRPVLSTEELTAGDHITIGETTLRFVPFCGPDFTWDAPQENGWAHASND